MLRADVSMNRCKLMPYFHDNTIEEARFCLDNTRYARMSFFLLSTVLKQIHFLAACS